MVDSITLIRLKCQQPYSFERTSLRLRHPHECLYVEEDGVLYRAIQGDSSPLLLLFEYNSSSESLEVTIHGQIDSGEIERLKHKLAQMWSTQKDLSPFYKKFADDPYLSTVIEERKGLHWVLTPTLYECLISSMISQQIHLSFAATLKRRLINLVGNQLEIKQRTFPLFPHPEQVASLTIDQLRNLQFSQRKAEYIIGISKKIANGNLDLEGLRTHSNEEIARTLLTYRGIGKWTVECLLLFGLGRENLLPAADIGLRNAIRKVYQLPERPSESEVREIGADWSPYQSYVTYYLWDYLSTK